jgi:hypothetical protein
MSLAFLYSLLEVITMNVKRRGHVAACVLVLVALLATAALASSVEKATDYGAGNAVFLIGGDKSTPHREPGQARASLAVVSAWGAIKSLYATKSTFYGDDFVKTSFRDTVYVTIPRQMIVVDGSSSTCWLGVDPQFNSSQIRLDEVWTFGGLLVTVSVPSGGGFSTSSKTASWSGGDTSGQHWEMDHIYSGIAAESLFPLTSVNHAANGSHYFETTNTWVSANAWKGITSL